MPNEDLPEAPKKWRCEDCGETCRDAEMLIAPNPFEPDDALVACPHCKEIGSLHAACYAEGCTKPASGGYPGGHGYRYVWTCWDHSPQTETPAQS